MPHKDITVLQRRHGHPPINPPHHALRVLLIAGAMLAAVVIACNQATEPEGLLPWPTPTPEAEPTQTPTFQPAEQVIPLPTKTAAATSTPTIPTPTLPQETTKATPPPAPTSHPGITHETGPASESDARFVQVSAGLFHTCGLRGDETITCWGAHGEDERRTETIGLLESPPGSFTQIDAGFHHSCAVRKDGTVECWGGSSFDDVPQTPEEKAMKEALLEPPEGRFMSVSVGLWLDCGIKVDNSAECWGIGPVISDELNPPEGKYTSVSVGDDHACGIRIDQTVVCWGSNQGFDGDFLGQATPPDGPFEVINAGGYHTCGFRPDGEIRCWGGIVGGPRGEFGLFCQLGPDATEICETREMNTVERCELRPDGTSRCWTDERATEADVAWGGVPDYTPDGNLKAIDSGQRRSCALFDGGHIWCWGSGGPDEPPPPGIFTAVTVGHDHGCGLRPDGRVECWGDDEFGQASPP